MDFLTHNCMITCTHPLYQNTTNKTHWSSTKEMLLCLTVILVIICQLFDDFVTKYIEHIINSKILD